MKRFHIFGKCLQLFFYIFSAFFQFFYCHSDFFFYGFFFTLFDDYYCFAFKFFQKLRKTFFFYLNICETLLQRARILSFLFYF
ncbi:MAG: hypothetical protein FJY91_01055 [Candidatus Harrisonbacteria bacterium]|nr:hypothetical protein [Candidatus Harrisonbacteria bacterium]